MDLKHLEQVAAICQCGSFSSAARRLGVSQPALSKSIARLEAELAVKLFERAAGAARPTEYGAFIAERAQGILRDTAILVHELELQIRGEQGRLCIGVGPVTCLKPLPDVVRDIASHFPKLQLETRHESVDALMRALDVGAYDLVFCQFEGAERYGDLIRIKIFEDRYAAAVRPGHPALSYGPLTPEQLLNYQLASFGFQPSFMRWLGILNPSQLENLKAFVSDDHDLVISRPKGTDFVARAPLFVLEQSFQSGSLVELPLLAPSHYECWMLTTEGRWRLPVVKAIADFAKAAASPTLERGVLRGKS